MKAFAHKANISNLHISQVGFGGDVFLKPGTQRFAEEVSEDGECQSEGQEEESPTGGFGASKWRPGKGRRHKRSGDHIGAATGMDSESAFTGVESRPGFGRRIRNIVELNIAEQKKAGRVGMSRHGDMIFAREDMQCGMFERVVAPGFEDERKI